MDAFSFVMVAYAIIIGLAMTQLLSSVGGLIQNRRRIRFHWCPLFWTGFLFFIQVRIWWSLWGMRELPQWDLLVLLAAAFIGTAWVQRWLPLGASLLAAAFMALDVLVL